jgi:hypothetical protein
MLYRNAARATERRGVILLVVLALLTLFAIVGISFVLYADSEATSARIYRESQQIQAAELPGFDPYTAFSLFMSQLLYDIPDDPSATAYPNATGLYSALRGQSLARNMYGYYDAPNALNDKPYNGTGRLRGETISTLTGPTTSPDSSYLVNYTYFSADGFLRDPERLGVRASVTNLSDMTQRGTFTGGLNPPYTYPDHQNFYLAMMRATDGKVLLPSFHRPWMFGSLASYPGNPGGLPVNPNWTNTIGKYLTLRPRPQDMSPGFPYPADDGGDVKNLDWAPGGNDSIWIDIGLPVMISGSGQKFKMLVAPLILDLDGRVNMNTAGNYLGQDANANVFHYSNQGWGPWEVNPSQVLSLDANPTSTPPVPAKEWANLTLGNPPTGVPSIQGRYGYDPVTFARLPQSTTFSPGGTMLRRYAPMDYNSIIDPGQTNAPQGTAAITYPPATPTPMTTPVAYPYQTIPYFPLSGYGQAVPVETTTTGAAGGTNNHPAYYNPLRPQGTNRLLPLKDFANMTRLGWGGTPNTYGNNWGYGYANLTSQFLQLCPVNFNSGSNSIKMRNLVTPLSMDLDRPAGPPFIWDPADTTATPITRYQYDTTKNYPFAQNIGFPDPTANRLKPNPPPAGPLAPYAPANSEFDAATWRNINTAIGRIDLGRKLTDFPTPVNGQIDLTNASNLAQYNQALADRQQFARDIFNVLRKVTGAVDLSLLTTTIPAPVGSYDPTMPEYKALRWLAQLAVNIVDYIDVDDYMTPFAWNPIDPTNPNDQANFATAQAPYRVVYGTEVPRLVLNESYAQYDNDGNDPLTGGVATTNYNLNVWVELHNPILPDPVDSGTVNLQIGTNPIYQVLITQPPGATPYPNALQRDPANVTGDPDYGQTTTTVLSTVNDWTATPANNTVTYVVNPAWDTTTTPPTPRYSDPNTPQANTGFYILGPKPAGTTAYQTGADPTLPNTLLSPKMSYAVPVTNATAGTIPTPTILLRRLANECLPPQTDPTQPNFNPYVTVDYIENVKVWDGRVADTAGARTPPGMTTRTSYGRSQPYAAVLTTGAAQWGIAQAPSPAQTTQPQHTFFRHNAVEAAAPPSASTVGQTLTVPFNWLVHLDRQPISTLELLHVSAFKPHELTQQFIDAGGNLYAHLAPWGNQDTATGSLTNGKDTRLYRFFEFATVARRSAGLQLGGRIPGKININTVWDKEVFRALCDAQAANQFTSAQVDALWIALMTSRSPTADPTPPSGVTPGTLYVPGAGDKPFWSLATGFATAGTTNDSMGTTNRGVDNTVLRPATLGASWNTGRLAEPGSATPAFTHPYQRYELLTKIFNNLTTRSNVFAVWLTVGFFDVIDDTTLPVKLGAETGVATNNNIRYRFFAIIDRTNMQVWPTLNPSTNAPTVKSLKDIVVPPAAAPAPAATSVQSPLDGTVLSALNGTNPYTNRTWTIQAGSVLVFEPDTDNEETVTVQADAMGNLNAIFYRSHLTGSVVISRGNPGPWPNYSPQTDSGVVPYYVLTH